MAMQKHPEKIIFEYSRPGRGAFGQWPTERDTPNEIASDIPENLRRKKPASLRLAALLQKPARTRVEVPIDYLGFTIPDRFVVGYGLDFDGRYRNLPHLAVLTA